MSDDVQEMRAIFLEEMAELVQDLETDLLQLESSPGSGLIDRLFRNLHTIKGGAGMVGLGPLSHYTHAVETMLDEVRKGGLVLSSALISLLLEALDCLKMFMAEAHGEATLDLQAVENSHTRILAATGEDPPVAGWAAPTETGPVCLVAAPRRDTTTGDLNTFILQVSARPDFFPRPSELEAVTGRLQMLGDLLCISHEHSLPVEGKRQAEIAYLWRSFHLVTEADAAAVLAALGDWPQRHKTELHHLTFLPEAPENQAQIDAAVDGSSHDVLGDQQIVPLPSGTVIPLPSAPAAQEFPRAANNGKVDAPAVYRRSSIRVETAKLDKLVNLVGELITVEARMESFHGNVEQRDPELAEGMQGIMDDGSRTLRELQDQAMTIRMVPIGDAFDPMQRLVRDYCRETGKKVQLTMLGRDTEVDKKVSEQISGPIKHLIRNALDHGIEPPAERELKGKAPVGEITLASYQQYGLIVIEIKDDGRGIDLEKVVASARRQGMIDGSRELSEQEALELIFMPAVSTAEVVTEVSGRGVGMDVVKRDIEALRGSVGIDSTAGSGTTITVRIPLTLSIVDGLLVSVGDNGYVIPFSAVEECVELDQHCTQGGASSFLEIRDDLIPFLRLRDLFGISGEPPTQEKVVIVSTGDRRMGLVVDTLIGEHQTVIKPLSRLHKDVECFSGTTILGDGRAVLILDVLHLIAYGQSREERMRA